MKLPIKDKGQNQAKEPTGLAQTYQIWKHQGDEALKKQLAENQRIRKANQEKTADR
ncbi:MAG: hypothetical protein HY231_24810 [Acidobacteria bacterium]|nr:hypothetical protein [Acidobacteriota bacterium]